MECIFCGQLLNEQEQELNEDHICDFCYYSSVEHDREAKVFKRCPTLKQMMDAFKSADECLKVAKELDKKYTLILRKLHNTIKLVEKM